MKDIRLYDFHTHIRGYEDFEKYYEYGIVPVVNCRNHGEYENLKKYFEKLIKKNEYTDESLYFSIGIHPNDSQKYKGDISEVYADIANKAPVIGEIGMDGCWCDVSFDIQESVFRQSLDLAKYLNKPVILHTKSMEKRIFDIIEDYELDFIIHWYSCENYISEFIEKNCYFTIGPAVLVDENVRSLVKMVPLDRLLLETDGLDALEWLFDKKYRADDLKSILHTVCIEISLLKNRTVEEIYDIIKKNSTKLLKA